MLKLHSEVELARRWRLWCFLAGLLTSTIYTFVLYPRIASVTGAVLDPDLYGALGCGLWKLHTFSYFPSHRPSIGRGPLYPMIVAALLQLSGGWWPYCVQLAQCVFFALTCLLAFETARRLWNINVGRITGLSCAVHPFLVWYTSRIWVEALSTLLFTTMMAAMLYFHEKPSIRRAALLGGAMGAACLCKGTFLPFLVAIPFLLWAAKPKAAVFGPTACSVLIAVLMILPWTARNWILTRRLIPVHGQVAFNIEIGDYLSAHFKESPLAVTPLWAGATAEAAALAQPALSEGYDGWRAETGVDSILIRVCAQRYIAHPMFLAHKILLHTVTFWTWSDTKLKTLVVSAMQIPLAAAFFWSVLALAKRGRLRNIRAMPAVLVLIFYASHLPVVAAARYSTVLVPTMLAYCVGALLEHRESGDKRKALLR